MALNFCSVSNRLQRINRFEGHVWSFAVLHLRVLDIVFVGSCRLQVFRYIFVAFGSFAGVLGFWGGFSRFEGHVWSFYCFFYVLGQLFVPHVVFLCFRCFFDFFN